MLRKSKMTNCVLLGITSFFFQAAHANEWQCGERIPVSDLQVVDMEEYSDQPALFQEKLQEQAGDFILVTQAPEKVTIAGNKANAINKASSFAAHRGCDLLVLLGESVKETRWQERVTTTRYLMIHAGKRESL